MTAKIPVIERFAQCRELCLNGLPHDAESIAEYRAMIAREYARRGAQRSVHPQRPLPGVE